MNVTNERNQITRLNCGIQKENKRKNSLAFALLSN